jgi:putative ABC transport system ATP-binding protein
VAAIDVRALTKEYRRGEPNAVTALDGITLGIRAGELVAVLGRAASGKTTLLHALGLLLRPTSGQVIIGGIDTATLTEGQRADFRGRRVGLVLRDRNLVPTLDVLENVLLPLRYPRIWIGRGAKDRARDLLDLVGLGDHLHDRADQLSAGQAQRVAIARALVRNPTLVLADEPTGEVDGETSDGLLALVQQVHQLSHVTFVVATHDIEVASRMDRMIRIDDGRVVLDERLRMAR